MNNISGLKKGDAVHCELYESDSEAKIFYRPFVGIVQEVLNDKSFLLNYHVKKKNGEDGCSLCTVTDKWHKISKIYPNERANQYIGTQIEFVLNSISKSADKPKKQKTEPKILTIVEALNLAKQGFSITNEKMNLNGSYIRFEGNIPCVINVPNNSATIVSYFTIDEVLANWQVVKVNDLKNNKSN